MCITANACHHATVGRALQSEPVKVRVDPEGCGHNFEHKISVQLTNGLEVVRIMVEETCTHTTVVIQQFGIGMLDGQDSLMLMDSQKQRSTEEVFGGQYGIGLKQLLAVLASLGADGWKFVMLGSVLHERSGRRGWSSLYSSAINNQLNVHGKLCSDGIDAEVSRQEKYNFRNINYMYRWRSTLMTERL